MRVRYTHRPIIDNLVVAFDQNVLLLHQVSLLPDGKKGSLCMSQSACDKRAGR